MNPEALEKLLQAAKAEDSGAAFSAMFESEVNTRAQAAVAEEVRDLKANKEKALIQLSAWRKLGEFETVKTDLEQIPQLKIAAKAGGKKVDEAELKKMAEEIAQPMFTNWKTEQDAVYQIVEDERDALTGRATGLEAAYRRKALESDVATHIGDDVPSHLLSYYVDLVEKHARVPDATNGEEFWQSGKPINWRLQDADGVPLVSKSGKMTLAEMVASGREGLGQLPFNNAACRDTFFPKQAKGGSATSTSTTVATDGDKDASALSLIDSGLKALPT